MASKRSSTCIVVPTKVYTGLELSRLEELVNDDAKFYEYFVTLELKEVEEAKKSRERITEANQQLASSTYGRKTEFEDKKAQVVDLSIKASELKEAYNQKYEALKSLSGKSDQKIVLKTLRDLSREVENKSEDLASGFLAGGIELRPEEFISQFRNMRTTYWLRKIKVEKMDKLIKKQPPSGSFFPYPMSGSGMPQPTVPSGSSPQGMRRQPTIPTPYPVTHSLSPASQPNSFQPTHSLPPSYVHARNPGPLPTQSVPPPSYAQASRMPMPQPQSSPSQGYPPPTASMYGRSPQQYGAPQPTYSVQPYPYGSRPPYPPRT